MHNKKLTLCLAVLLLAGATYALSACTLVRGVSTAGATNMGGAQEPLMTLPLADRAAGQATRAAAVVAAAAADETDPTASMSGRPARLVMGARPRAGGPSFAERVAPIPPYAAHE
jgi:hypothetical protein